MKFFHGTSVRAWIGIIKSGSMDSKKANDSKVSALYSKYKGNYLTSNRAIAEMYAKRVGSGVILEIEFDPNAPGRVNNFKKQIANGKDYFVEETPLEVDGANCSIECKDPTKTKAKVRAEFSINIKPEVHMENEVNLERTWKKLEESINEMSAEEHLAPLRVPSVDTDGNKIPGALKVDNPDHRSMLKKQSKTKAPKIQVPDIEIESSINEALELLKKIKK